MTFEADLKTHLQSAAAIAALVGDRIHPMVLPAGSRLPAVTYQEVNSDPASGLDGGDGSLMNYRMQINCWAESYLGAKALAELVRVRLRTSASSFKAVPLSSGQDVYEENTKRFGHYRDFSFWYHT